MPFFKPLSPLTFAVCILGSLLMGCSQDSNSSLTRPSSPADPGTTPPEIATYFSQLKQQLALTSSSETLTLTLPNQMRVTLISDKKASKSAASFSVNVGLNSDPLPYRGLAHYLEHMLFLGSKKYPTPGEFKKFTQIQSGMANAYTSAVETNYHFSINTTGLAEGLDRMTQFFVEPLFDQKYLDQEILAIQSEYDKNLENNQWRYQYLYQHNFSQTHPFRHMFQGNKETLGNVPRSVMLDFFNRYYSANTMNVVIVSPLALSDLKSLAENILGQIPNRNVDAQKTAEAPLTVPATLYEIKSTSNTPQLRLDFVLPSESKQYWQTKSFELVAKHLSSSKEGGLVHALKAKGFITNFIAYYHNNNDMYSTLSTSISLTAEGEKQWSVVARMLIKTIEDIKKQPLDVELFRNTKRASELNYLFDDSSDPLDKALFFASRNREGFRPDALERTVLFSKFSPETYAADLRTLDISKLYIYRFSSQIQGQKTTDFYNMSFNETPLKDLDWLKSFDQEKGHTLKFVANPYLPQSLQLIDEADDLHRQTIVNETALKASLLRNTQFKQPFVTLNLNFVAQQSDLKTNKDFLMNSILAEYLREDFKEGFSEALEALYKYEWSVHSRGLNLQLQGFSEKISPFAIDFIKEALRRPLNARLFQVIKEKRIIAVSNLEKGEALSHAASIHQSYAMPNTANPDTQLKELEQMTLEDINNFRGRVLQKSYVRLLTFGNISQAAAKDLSLSLKNILNSTPTSPELRLVIYKFPTGTHSVLKPRTGGNNAWVSEFHLGGPNDLKTQALTQLLGPIIAGPFYTYMRTEKQLGYIVGASVKHRYLDSSLRMVVQSLETSTKVGEIGRNWLQQFTAELEKISSEDLATYKKAVLTQLMDTPDSYADLATTKYMLFRYDLPDQYDQSLAEQINSVTVEDLVRFYKEKMVGSDRREVSAYVQSVQSKESTTSIPPTEKVIPDMKTFKDLMEIY